MHSKWLIDWWISNLELAIGWFNCGIITKISWKIRLARRDLIRNW